MKRYRIVFYMTFVGKDGEEKGISFKKKYKARDLEHLQKKIDKFLEKLGTLYTCEGVDIKELNKEEENEDI